ncbi:MAG: hypothetical protein N2561_04860 [Bacteroidetes bacterium]|nr:hypothetical protein [Rhodothermia bacterium]MCS7154477.1 hypothetical protein [Bacteroidota bacterium]MCX7906850.1 hypothetical protein [Bacteroidota bacterium]MDW8136871.1 hypothetical protein [Bacteroidota bacterium]MDW8285259.1 hypothetical protein [Bacteroidota bacterium]
MRNPLWPLISDEAFWHLQQHNLLNERELRNYVIRRQFLEMRAQKISASEAIDRLQQQYPQLEYDTIRKIVYRTRPKAPHDASL